MAVKKSSGETKIQDVAAPKKAAPIKLTDRQLAEALDRAQTLSATLNALVDRLEMRLRFRG